MQTLAVLLEEVRACHICEGLPLGPKPILQAASGAKILIAGQAPGAKTHEKGRPFDDASGDRLRHWLGVDKASFYDPGRFAILPMGFCFPGSIIRQGRRQGDMPPRPECAAAWRERLLAHLPHVELTLVLGTYALDWHLPKHRGLTVEATDWQAHWPKLLVLPHPSPRNGLWLKRHPEFEANVIPKLQQRVSGLLGLN
ncbi:uracil-DNA glycosylase family protein [Shewanella zhangzhouensis]|uniref:uracil-DNA glycosylase family protein n=1 Tax=Shewanella zhangzhouensis TaxID=2864213 RepID=UPI001C65EF3B|nr:uracil-DNA glycosylase family protein [Shewanella zhangzhouensis]QYK06467.1 uracil-DNA glycosylase family protein [Shewanella zhangzhouensis]